MSEISFSEVERLLGSGEIVDFFPGETNPLDAPNQKLVFTLANGQTVFALVTYNRATNEIFPPQPVSQFYQRPSATDSLIDWSKTYLVFSRRTNYLPPIPASYTDISAIPEDVDLKIPSRKHKEIQSLLRRDDGIERNVFHTVEFDHGKIGAGYLLELSFGPNTRIQLWLTNENEPEPGQDSVKKSWALIYSSPESFYVAGMNRLHAFVYTSEFMVNDETVIDDPYYDFETLRNDTNLLTDDLNEAIEAASATSTNLLEV